MNFTILWVFVKVFTKFGGMYITDKTKYTHTCACTYTHTHILTVGSWGVRVEMG